MRNIKFIDLFAGIGGMRSAFQRENVECVFSSEIDKYARETYYANFGGDISGDITEIEASEIPEFDILVAGFPCQPFSLAGVPKYESLGYKHGFNHETKGTLFFEIMRIIEYHKPRAILLENVKNLKSHDKGKTFKIILESLEKQGYDLHYQVIDAASVVPQHRERIFIVGFREKKQFEFPIYPEKGKIKLREILEERVDEKYTISDKLWDYLQERKKKQREKGNGFGYNLSKKDEISRTLSARYGKDGSEILIYQQNKNPRRLTPRECARLMSFPEEFEIPVSDTQAYKQFGNSVVIKVVQPIATSIIETLNNVHDEGNIMSLNSSGV
tara:strand:+ start:27 stop:1013 length:987 start_codon:yes stop_codon:yes gene_type:complete